MEAATSEKIEQKAGKVSEQGEEKEHQSSGNNIFSIRAHSRDSFSGGQCYSVSTKLNALKFKKISWLVNKNFLDPRFLLTFLIIFRKMDFQTRTDKFMLHPISANTSMQVLSLNKQKS